MPNNKIMISQYILNDIANAIKTKKNMGEQEKIKPINMATAIASISGDSHLPITVNITQSEHQTISVTPVNVNNASVNNSISVPETIVLSASISADSGYSPGTLNQTTVNAQWGNTYTFSATAAEELDVYHINVTQPFGGTIYINDQPVTPDGVDVLAGSDIELKIVTDDGFDFYGWEGV